MTSNIISDTMPNLVFVKDNQAVTTTFALSQWANRIHQDILRIVTHNIDALKEFGEVSFETYPVKTKSGTQRFKIATLNYDQACFVICSMRNNKQTKNFKVELLLAFRKCREQLANARKAYSEDTIKKLQTNEFNAGYEVGIAIGQKQIKQEYENKLKDYKGNLNLSVTKDFKSDDNKFKFGIDKNSLVFEFLNLKKKIKANKEQWNKEVEQLQDLLVNVNQFVTDCVELDSLNIK